jgi:Protein of unknown function (DUF1580)
MPGHSQILDERRISLHETTRLLGTDGRPTHLSTALRAITRGVKSTTGARVKLEALRVGGRWVTSREAVERFIMKLTGAALGEPEMPAVETSAQRERELARVDRELVVAGF